MGRSIFIKEIITILKEPKLCPTCQKEDKFEKDLVREAVQMERQYYVLDVRH